MTSLLPSFSSTPLLSLFSLIDIRDTPNSKSAHASNTSTHTTERRTPLRRTPVRRTAQNFELFSLSRSHFRSFSGRLLVSFFLSSEVFSCFFLSLSLGSFRGSLVVSEAPGPKRHKKTTRVRERERESEICGGRVEKSVKFGAHHPSGPNPSDPPTSHPSGPPTPERRNATMYLIDTQISQIYQTLVLMLDFLNYPMCSPVSRPCARPLLAPSR